MKKEYNYPRHGNSPGESTKQHVHADTEPNGHNNLFSQTKNTSMLHTTQNKTMKSKTMSLLLLALFGFLTLFMVGCQKDDDRFESSQVTSQKQGLEDVSKVSLQRLAEMQGDETVNPSLYDEISKRVQSLSQEDYDKYLSYWISNGIQELIDKKLITENQRQSETELEYQKRMKYDEKSKELYSVPMYKLDLNQQMKVLDSLRESSDIKTSQKASCPKYYFPYSVSNDGTGTYSCVAVYAATNPADSDCDWEFQYNTPIALGKAKTLSLMASAIFAYGGINARIPSAPYTNQARFLVGQDKIDYAYTGSGYSAALLFASDVKFR